MKAVFTKLLFPLLVLAGLFPFFYFSIVELGVTEASAEAEASGVAINGAVDRFIDNSAFGVGEKLTFDIGYGFITAGTGTLEVVGLVEFENRPCYQIITRAYSSSFFSSFYKVDDRVESIMDATGIFSWRFEKNLREGNYRSDRQYTFDQRNHRVVYKGDTTEIPPYVQDAISTLYYARTQPLEVGQSIYLDNFIDGRQLHLEAKVLKKETVTVEAGTFDCVVVEPLTQSVGLFKHDGQLKVWLTDDHLHMPVMMKSKIIVGSITAELVDFELGRMDEF